MYKIPVGRNTIQHCIRSYFDSQGLSWGAGPITPLGGDAGWSRKVVVLSTKKYWERVLRPELELILKSYPDILIAQIEFFKGLRTTSFCLESTHYFDLALSAP